MGRLAMLNLVLRLLSLAGQVVSVILFLSATSGYDKNCDNNIAFDFNVKPQFTFNKFSAYR
nr:CASP-like protein PIMP1 [Ipomoea trifida]